jgi:hypothetical protein
VVPSSCRGSGRGRPTTARRDAGPIIRTTEGEDVEVPLDNTDADMPHTVHFHGVRKTWENDGVFRVDPEGYEPADQEPFVTVEDWDSRRDGRRHRLRVGDGLRRVRAVDGVRGVRTVAEQVDVRGERSPAMERTPTGTPVGVDDPYAHADRCDHLTDDGRCRFALEHGGDGGGRCPPSSAEPRSASNRTQSGDSEGHSPSGSRPEADDSRPFAGDGEGRRPPSNRPSAGDDPAFAAARRAEDYACVVAGEADWSDCPHYRSTTEGRECRRCGLDEVRLAHEDTRPLIEEHHLSYGGSESDDAPAHEITVSLCRWCHAKVHAGWARVDDDVNPDAEALAAREERRSAEQAEFGFRTAAERDER